MALHEWRNWLHRQKALLSRSNHRKPRLRKSTCRLSVEQFEDRCLPSVTIHLDPGSDSGFQGDNITNVQTPLLTGTADNPADSIKVEEFNSVHNTTAVLGTVAANGTGDWQFTTPTLAEGKHDLFAVDATTASESTTDLFLKIDLTAPNPPDSLALDAVTDSGAQGDNLTNFTKPTINGHAEPGSTVELFDNTNATLLGSATADGTTGDWSITSSVDLAEGANNLSATATDAAGNTSAASATLTITLATTAPGAPTNLALDAATDSGILGDNLTNFTNPTIDGKADPGTTVTLLEGSTALGTATADGNGNWSITSDSPLTDGPHSLTATATNAAGNTSAASAVLTVTIDTVNPPTPSAPTLDPASDDGVSGTDNITSQSNVTLHGNTMPDTTVQVFDGSTLLGSATANSSGSWTLRVANLSNGVHQFSVTASNKAGNTSSPSLAVTIDATGVKANPLTNFTDEVAVTIAKVKKKTQNQITLTNNTGRTIQGPVFFVLIGLKKKSKVKLKKPSGMTAAGNPFVSINPGTFAAGASLTFTLTFTGPPPKFTPSVQIGFGTPT